MIRQKNKVITFLFSLIPGAGQMYLGFMKRGLSLILYVVFIACVVMMLSMEELLILIPPVWMYSFFDAINLNGADEEYFRQLSDEYVTFDFVPGIQKLTGFSGETRRIWGWGLFFTGIMFLGYNIFIIVGQIAYFADFHELEYFINNILRYAPRIVIGTVLIIMGKSLVSGKKKAAEDMDVYMQEYIPPEAESSVEAEVAGTVYDEPVTAEEGEESDE